MPQRNVGHRVRQLESELGLVLRACQQSHRYQDRPAGHGNRLSRRPLNPAGVGAGRAVATVAPAWTESASWFPSLGARCPAPSPLSPGKPRHEPLTTPKTSPPTVPISPNQPEHHGENARKVQKPYRKPCEKPFES